MNGTTGNFNGPASSSFYHDILKHFNYVPLDPRRRLPVFLRDCSHWTVVLSWDSQVTFVLTVKLLTLECSWVLVRKTWDDHLVEIIIFRQLVFFICICIKNPSFTDPRILANFRPKVACSDVTKSVISIKKNPTDLKKKSQTMSNCCLKRSAKNGLPMPKKKNGGF